MISTKIINIFNTIKGISFSRSKYILYNMQNLNKFERKYQRNINM